MSDLQPPRPPPKPPLNPLLAVLMALVGIVLLLPGLCAVIFGIMMVSEMTGGEASGLIGALPLWLLGMLLGALGVGLIVRAFRR